MFSKACEYGIKATIYVALQSMENSRVSLNDIAREIDSPVAFTAKILQKLSRNNILESTVGPSGGFQIQRKNMELIKLSMIVDAIDGDAIYTGCGLGLQECNADKPCPAHDKFVRIRDDLKEMLENTNVYELATSLEVGSTFLRR